MARGEHLHRAIAIRAEGQGPCAGGLEASVAVAPAQAHELARAGGSIGHQPPGGRAGLFSPADEPRRRPLGMRGGPGACAPAWSTAVVVSAVRGDAAALVVELDGRRGVSRLDQFVNELVGHAVEVAFDLDMVINVDATGRPMRQDVAGGGQGLQCRAVEPRIARASADPELLHRTVVELVEQRPDRAIQGVETEEGLMAQPGENPPLGEEDAVFDRGLVAGLPRAGRDHHGPVVRRQLLIRSIEPGS